jgi:hypothetical protein
MKIILTFGVIILSAIFGTGSFAQGNSSDVSKEKNKNAAERTRSKETMDYDSRVYNECTSEWVHLKGKITYSIKEDVSDDKYYISYQMNLKQVEGIGETTGTVYKGGGIIKDRVHANNKNGNTVGSNIYKVRYKAPNTTLIYTQKAHYVFAGGEVKVSFDDSSDSCK